MAKLRYVWFWPNGGRRRGRWEGSAADDAFARTSRRVTERYSEMLATSGIEARRSAVQMFVSTADEDAPAAVVEVHPLPAGDEAVRAFIPPLVAGLTPAARARLVLDVVDAAMRCLGRARGWPVEPLVSARQHALDHDLGFSMAGSWKANPSRTRRARLVARIGDDGWSELCLEVADGRSGESLGFTDRVSSPVNSLPKFKRSVRELRWAGDDVLERPNDSQIRIGDTWGRLDVFRADELSPWPQAIEPAHDQPPMQVVVREL